MSILELIRDGSSRYFAGVSGGLLVACSPAAVDGNGAEARETAAGVMAPACEGCPEFVAVPPPPESLRPIVAVAKYELTWNNYLAAVDDGACIIQNPNRPPFFRSRPDEINPNLEWFRIDWPITILDPVDVDCYLEWLNDRIDAKAVIPTKQEWRWFASAGHSDWLYPWGNDPSAGHEMLAKTISDDAVRVPWAGQRRLLSAQSHLRAFKVGQGEPNPWGIHDLLGNAAELTSTMKPVSENVEGRPVVKLAGTFHWDPDWAEKGLDANYSSVIWDGQYAGEPAIRVVLIRGNTGE